MPQWLTYLRLSLLALVVVVSIDMPVIADETTPDTLLTAGNESTSVVNAQAELPKMQKILDKIKGQVSGEKNANKLDQLNALALELSVSADTLEQTLIPQRAQLLGQLAVLGAEPGADSNVREIPEVTHKRHALQNQQNKLDEQIKQTETIKHAAVNLSSQIIKLRRETLKNQLALNSGTIFGGRFWMPLLAPDEQDSEKISDFHDELHDMAAAAWAPGWRLGTAFWVVAAIVMAFFGRHAGERFLGWFSINRLPEGRLRRSFLAVATTLTTLISVMLAFDFMDVALTRRDDLPANVQEFIDRLVQLSIFCGLIAGLGRAFLSTQRPSWRLPALSDELALALKPFPPMAALLVFVFQTVEIFNSCVGTGLNTTIFANGLTALLIGSMVLSISLRSSRIRYHMLKEGDSPETRSTLSGLIQLATTLAGVAILVALVIGYVTLARFLSYELIWIWIVFSSLYLLSHLVTDGCESLLSVHNATGKRLQALLNIHERHLAQASVLLAAIGKTLLILLTAVALLNGTLGSFTPLELMQKTIEFLGGKGLESLNIVPAQLLVALLSLCVGIYVLHAVRRWLDKELLPKTEMDNGMRVSLTTLFTNVGYVLIILITLSLMGVQWNKLAWIVSALSVGIGFGLQEIVKNFISGLILLTERPVKVGDLVSISGIEGDIRRISVRATEIQLIDRSTVIVPNSQLISQNVRNATMGNAQGVVTIVLTFPLDIDPLQVRELLLHIYRENETILELPTPSVSFKELTSAGIVLSVTGNVSSQRQITRVKSDLLFEILSRLRCEGIPLSSPQSVLIEHKTDEKTSE